MTEAANYAGKTISESSMHARPRPGGKADQRGKTVIEVDNAEFAEHFKDYARQRSNPDLADWVSRIVAMADHHSQPIPAGPWSASAGRQFFNEVNQFHDQALFKIP